ncbi:MAG TPA: hypothetical protein VNL92_02935, partial [Dehalococcoidia bacterium]|nr:hypothetical protein [Dehalococcoidia bacterium]
RAYPGPFRLDASPDLPQAAREGLAALPVLGDLMAASPDTTGRRSIERLFESLESDLKSIGGDLEHAYRSQPRCVIHGSFSPGVLLFEGDNLVSVDGMQSARYDCLLADLAQAITAFCSTKKRGLFSPPALDPDRYRTFLRAYRKEAPLTREQLDVFALVLRIQRLLGVMEESRRFLTATLHGQDSIHLAPTSRNGACSATDAAL